jgi:hypothetical protein
MSSASPVSVPAARARRTYGYESETVTDGDIDL